VADQRVANWRMNVKVADVAMWGTRDSDRRILVETV